MNTKEKYLLKTRNAISWAFNNGYTGNLEEILTELKDATGIDFMIKRNGLYREIWASIDCTK